MRFISLVLSLFLFSEIAAANVVGSDLQNFNPITSGLDFVTVQSSETLKPGIVNLGLFLNYAVNTLPYFDNTSQGRTEFTDSLLGLDMNVGVGLTSDWDVGISLPFILSQSVSSNNAYRGEFAKNGNTEFRLNSKYRLFGDDAGGVAVVGSANFNRVIDNPYTGTNSNPTYNLEIAADTSQGDFAYGMNIGYRWRTPGKQVANSPIQPLRDQIIGSIAASYFIASYDTKLISEIFGSLPSEKNNSDLDRSLTTAEWIVGLKHDLSTQLALHIGAGTEILHGLSSPDWRVYSGLNYSFGPILKNEPPVLEKVVGEEGRYRTRSIYFRFDSDVMIGGYAEALSEVARELLEGESFKELFIEGHTDSVGPAAYNQDLSMRRAQAIRRHLVNVNKVPATKIIPLGYGETRPIANNGNYQGRQLNRRVEFKVTR